MVHIRRPCRECPPDICSLLSTGLVSRIGARPLIRSRLVAFGSKSTSKHPQKIEGTNDAATGKSRVTSSLGVSKDVKATRSPRSVGSTAKTFKVGPCFH